MTTTHDETYNGWANRETWALTLWLRNDEGNYYFMRDLAQRLLPEDENDITGQDEDRIKDEIEEWYDTLITGGGDVARMIVSDIGSLWRVDWGETTKAVWESYYG